MLRVPLFVWSLEEEPPAGSPWGDVAAVGTRSSLRAAYARLRDTLDTQKILWAQGRYLPQEIQLVPGTTGIELIH